jgi:hypothetical protein
MSIHCLLLRLSLLHLLRCLKAVLLQLLGSKAASMRRHVVSAQVETAFLQFLAIEAAFMQLHGVDAVFGNFAGILSFQTYTIWARICSDAALVQLLVTNDARISTANRYSTFAAVTSCRQNLHPKICVHFCPSQDSEAAGIADWAPCKLSASSSSTSPTLPSSTAAGTGKTVGFAQKRLRGYGVWWASEVSWAEVG